MLMRRLALPRDRSGYNASDLRQVRIHEAYSGYWNIHVLNLLSRRSIMSPKVEVRTASEETYNDKVVRQFMTMTVVWGIVGMLVGVVIAAQLCWPALNFDIPWLTYGRLRPLHTNAVIFAFGGSALIGTSYYVVQRTCHVRLFSDRLAAFTFWVWQAVILAAAISLPLGFTQGKEYAELEWPIDIFSTRPAH